MHSSLCITDIAHYLLTYNWKAIQSSLTSVAINRLPTIITCNPSSSFTYVWPIGDARLISMSFRIRTSWMNPQLINLLIFFRSIITMTINNNFSYIVKWLVIQQNPGLRFVIIKTNEIDIKCKRNHKMHQKHQLKQLKIDSTSSSSHDNILNSCLISLLPTELTLTLM